MGFSDRFEIEVAPHPFLRSVSRFRSDAGYPGVTFAAVEPPAPPPAALPPIRKRLAELHALLDAQACPRPRTPLEAYCLVFQLAVAVDNKYFGPFNPKADNAARLGFPEVARAIGLANEPAATALPFRDRLLVLDPAGDFHFRPAASAAAAPAGPLEQLRRYVEAASLAAPPAPDTCKRERVARFLDFLRGAPRPASDLAALTTVTRLFLALEQRYCADAGPRAGERLVVPLPFMFYASPVFPGALLVFTIAHVMVYHPGGSLEIHECAPAGARTGGEPVRIGQPVLRLDGR